VADSPASSLHIRRFERAGRSTSSETCSKICLNIEAELATTFRPKQVDHRNVHPPHLRVGSGRCPSLSAVGWTALLPAIICPHTGHMLVVNGRQEPDRSQHRFP
jgi:hypothetical protein